MKDGLSDDIHQNRAVPMGIAPLNPSYGASRFGGRQPA